MAGGDQPPLERHLLQAPQREPREPEVPLDVAEHGLHVDGAPLPQGGPGLGAQHLACAPPVLAQGRVHLDLPGRVRVLRLRAPLPARASRAVRALVHPHRALVAQLRHPRELPDEAERAALRAGVRVVGLVVFPVGDPHLVLAPLPVAALAEELGVLDVGVDVLGLEVGVVLLAPVAGVGHEARGQAPEPLLDVLAVRDGARGVAGALVHGGVDYELVLRAGLDVVARLELAVAHGVVLHPHERGVGVGLREALAAGEDGLLLLVPLHPGEVVALDGAGGAAQLPGLGVPALAGLALGPQPRVDPVRRLADGVGVDRGGVLGRERLLLVVQLVDGLQVGAHLAAQRVLVPVGGLLPDERELVGVGLDLGAVEEVGVERDVAGVGQDGDDLGEHVLEHGADALRAEAVDRVVVEGAHAGEPHEVHVLAGGRRDLAAGVDAAGVAEQDDLEHHRRVVGRGAAAGVGGLQDRAVHAVHDRVHHAHERALGDELLDGGREEHGLVLHAGLELRGRHLSS